MLDPLLDCRRGMPEHVYNRVAFRKVETATLKATGVSSRVSVVQGAPAASSPMRPGLGGQDLYSHPAVWVRPFLWQGRVFFRSRPL